MTTLGERLRASREAAGISRKELSEKSGVSYTALADIENGSSRGSRSIATLAAVLGVSPLWLETGHGPMRPTDSAPPALPADVLALLSGLKAKTDDLSPAVKEAAAGLVARYLTSPPDEAEAAARALDAVIKAAAKK